MSHTVCTTNFKIAVSILFFSVCLGLSFFPQDAPGSVLHPGPEPFSVDAGSAVFCINLLKGNRYLEKNDTGGFRVIQVESVWSEQRGYDDSSPAGHRTRYEIIVNGSPLDWDRSYIEYGNEILNMRLLFLYRNQHPPRGMGEYSINDF